MRDSLPAAPATTPPAVHVRHLVSASTAVPEADDAHTGSGVAAEHGAHLDPVAEEPVADASTVGPPVYVPRALLSVAPVARTPVVLEWPAISLPENSYSGILKLYLDEHGRVERVEPDAEAVLPAPLYEAAKQAFLATEFTPGQLNGQVVRSRIRVEVNFEAGTPLPSPASP
ncbi:MAG: hypothetical protein EON93_00475 [Burkholderiales bacterium]|nr:MAG: hypothetical protein EON93_00475 [Burkholderiales bacterium]